MVSPPVRLVGLLAWAVLVLVGCGPNNAYCEASPFCLPRADQPQPYGGVVGGPITLRLGETRRVTVELVFPAGAAPAAVRVFNIDVSAGDGNPLATPGGDVQVTAPAGLSVGPDPFELVVQASAGAALRARQPVQIGLSRDGRVRAAPFGAVTLELNVQP